LTAPALGLSCSPGGPHDSSSRCPVRPASVLPLRGEGSTLGSKQRPSKSDSSQLRATSIGLRARTMPRRSSRREGALKGGDRAMGFERVMAGEPIGKKQQVQYVAAYRSSVRLNIRTTWTACARRSPGRTGIMSSTATTASAASSTSTARTPRARPSGGGSTSMIKSATGRN